MANNYLGISKNIPRVNEEIELETLHVTYPSADGPQVVKVKEFITPVCVRQMDRDVLVASDTHGDVFVIKVAGLKEGDTKFTVLHNMDWDDIQMYNISVDSYGNIKVAPDIFSIACQQAKIKNFEPKLMKVMLKGKVYICHK